TSAAAWAQEVWLHRRCAHQAETPQTMRTPSGSTISSPVAKRNPEATSESECRSGAGGCRTSCLEERGAAPAERERGAPPTAVAATQTEAVVCVPRAPPLPLRLIGLDVHAPAAEPAAPACARAGGGLAVAPPGLPPPGAAGPAEPEQRRRLSTAAPCFVPAWAGERRATNGGRKSISPAAGPPHALALTTVMLRNVPNNYTRETLVQLLDHEGFSHQYDL
ncbi:unnamed protein product, partial [Prorocentrum cordatum]